MKRRHFIFTPLLFVVGNSFANSQQKLGEHLVSSSHGVTTLLKKFSKPLSAAAVGEQYLHDNPNLDEQKLFLSVGLGKGANIDGSVHQRFETKKAHDFEIGNTLCLDGWILSKAEVSLCALAFIATLNS